MKSVFTIMGDIFRKHGIVILVGVAMALLVASPQLRVLTSIGVDDFKGVYPMFSDDEVTYLARIKEVTEGNIFTGNPYIKEHMNDPFIMPPIAEWTFAFFLHVTGASVPFIMSVSDGVLGFTCFILIYILFYTLTRSVWMSLLYTLLFFVFSLSTFGRPISPQFNAIFLFLGLIAAVKIYFWGGVQNRKGNLLAGFITGITCFISPYYFTALLAFYVLIFTARAMRERSIEVVRQNAPWFFVTFLPLASLYAFFQFEAAQDPSYSETVLRYGLMHTHIPGSFTNMLFGGIAFGILLLSFKSISDKKFVFALGTLATIFALNWQNILTGKSLQFSSHYLFTTILLVFIVLALLHAELLSEGKIKFGKYKRILISVGILILMLVIGHNQKWEFMNIGSIPYSRQELIAEQEKMDVFNWFNEHTKADSVVYTLGGRYDFLLPIYTHNKVFYNFYAALYPALHRETEERWIIQHLFDQNVSSSTVRDAQRDFWGNRYIDSYQSRESRKKILSFVTRTPYVPEQMVLDAQVEYMYKRWLDIGAQPIENNLSRYEIDYIFLSNEYPYFTKTKQQLDEMLFLSHVTTLRGGLVYFYQREQE